MAALRWHRAGSSGRQLVLAVNWASSARAPGESSNPAWCSRCTGSAATSGPGPSRTLGAGANRRGARSARRALPLARWHRDGALAAGRADSYRTWQPPHDHGLSRGEPPTTLRAFAPWLHNRSLTPSRGRGPRSLAAPRMARMCTTDRQGPCRTDERAYRVERRELPRVKTQVTPGRRGTRAPGLLCGARQQRCGERLPHPGFHR